jgi:hypothetical protein
MRVLASLRVSDSSSTISILAMSIANSGSFS